MVVVVVSAEAFSPREEARDAGARAVVWFASDCDAAAPLAEPSFTTVTCTATDWTVVLTPATAEVETFKVLAMAEVLTTGAAREPPLLVLTLITTLKDEEVCIDRRREFSSARRRVEASTEQEESPAQTVTVRAWAMSVAVTPAGKGTSTCVVCTMLTWTLSEPVLAPAAACVTVEARTAGSRVDAALGSMSRVEVVA